MGATQTGIRGSEQARVLGVQIKLCFFVKFQKVGNLESFKYVGFVRADSGECNAELRGNFFGSHATGQKLHNLYFTV